MRETPAEHEARTGRPYDPPARGWGRPLSADEAVGTLFRSPGACGFAEWLPALTPGAAPSRGFLAPPHRPDVLASPALVHDDALSAPFFGTIALLRPLVFDPVVAPSGPGVPVFVVPNHARLTDVLVWVPPEVVRGEIAVDWDGVATPTAAWAAYGPRGRASLARVAAAIPAYLDELAAVRASGQPGPGRPWCTVPADERRARLEAAGVWGAWSRAGRRAA